jgi:hypothetical protein
MSQLGEYVFVRKDHLVTLSGDFEVLSRREVHFVAHLNMSCWPPRFVGSVIHREGFVSSILKV